MELSCVNLDKTSLSVFDILKVGIGPSSSHTTGPWKAALLFLEQLKAIDMLHNVDAVMIDLYGSLALTGRGHGTDLAIVLGLSGFSSETIPVEDVMMNFEHVKKSNVLLLNNIHPISFDLKKDLQFNCNKILSIHPNGMCIKAFDLEGKQILHKTYFSIGGGFVIEENSQSPKTNIELPFPIENATDLQSHCKSKRKHISWVVRQNEKAWTSEADMEQRLLDIWQVMLQAVFKGCHTKGILPGGLNVNRRAHGLHQRLVDSTLTFSSATEWLDFLIELPVDFEKTLKFVNCFAMATNEENANYGRIVTAPTNGSSGVIPAVLMYYICFSKRKRVTNKDIIDFLCTASEIGSIFKKRATISAAMGGCQAEIGVSSSMAAAALTAALGGSVDQSLMAAEIAMEHHLGLTCDPVGGLVQIPCIERNSMGAIKAITASQIALESNPKYAKVSLDMVVKTMWETAIDMNYKYKETSQGGLATNISVSIVEC